VNLEVVSSDDVSFLLRQFQEAARKRGGDEVGEQQVCKKGRTCEASSISSAEN
jgi:hypothetical protein